MDDVRRDVGATIARASSGWNGAALFLALSFHAAAARAQPVVPASEPSSKGSIGAEDGTLSPIVVTGRNRRGAVATEVPPEVSIGSAAIQALGAADLVEVFEDLAPEIGTGETGTGKHGATAIVLVNGQRIAGFSSIKDFPPEAVDRIEIFPEKVALQYGYGAGQRVVNIVLRSDYRSLTLLGRDTLAPSNWRGIYRGKIDLLRINENSHWDLDLDYRHEGPIYADTTLAGPSSAVTADTRSARHTFATQDDHLTISGLASRKIGNVTAELAGSLDLDALQSRPGLSDEDGDLLAREGLSSLVAGPLNRIDRTVEAQTSLTLNGKLDTWRWSFIGKLDEETRITKTDAVNGAKGLQPVLLPSPGLFGHGCDTQVAKDCVSTTTRTGSGDYYINASLFSLPAGPVTAAVRTGFAFSGIRSEANHGPQAGRMNRDEGSVQANVDAPVSSRSSGLGEVSLGINGALRQLSDFGTLSTIGSTLEWSPVKPVDVLATFSREQQAPSLIQLGEAGLATPNVRAFDFVNDATALVHQTNGGNDTLRRQTSQIEKLRLQLNPLRSVDLVLSAEYTNEHTRNPIGSLTAATAATMEAFRDRFTRNGQGYLTGIDVSPVNFDHRDQQQLRTGITYSTAFGSAHSDRERDGSFKPPARDQFQIALYHTLRLQDEVVLRNGLPKLNLLDGDIINDGGGTPTQQVELQTSVSTGAWSADINAVWQNRTKAIAGPLLDDRLTFSQGITLNLRLQLNLADQRWLVNRLPWLSGNLNLSADNLLGAHSSVHDRNGAVPSAYEQSYLNPTGRTFRLTFRKHFH